MTESRVPSIESVLRHRAPMSLLDRIERDDESSTACSLTIRDDSTFVERGEVPAYVAIEYMAQCVAVHAGLSGARRNRPARIGYLIGARAVEFNVDAFRIGDRVTVEIEHVWGDDTLGQFDARVLVNDRGAASGQLTVYQFENDGSGPDAAVAT